MWPIEILRQLGREPRVGDWWCECCLDDLACIDSKENLDDLLEFNEDEYTGQRYWPDEASARAALANDSCSRVADGSSIPTGEVTESDVAYLHIVANCGERGFVPTVWLYAGLLVAYAQRGLMHPTAFGGFVLSRAGKHELEKLNEKEEKAMNKRTPEVEMIAIWDIDATGEVRGFVDGIHKDFASAMEEARRGAQLDERTQVVTQGSRHDDSFHLLAVYGFDRETGEARVVDATGSTADALSGAIRSYFGGPAPGDVWILPKRDEANPMAGSPVILSNADAPPIGYPEGECRITVDMMRTLGLGSDADMIEERERRDGAQLILRWKRRPEDHFIPGKFGPAPPVADGPTGSTSVDPGAPGANGPAAPGA